MIQPIPKLNKEEKSISRQVNLAVTSPLVTTEYLHWSEQPIEFNREDHPITIPRPGNAPLVLKARIGGYDVERVFMDAGSGINLIYAKTLRAMHISLEFLKPTDCSFHGIVPGSANYPLGRIALDVCFSNCKNYRKEKLNFEFMDWPSQYHAILGRPTFSRFMAVPHYTYLVLKMPGPRGITYGQQKDKPGTTGATKQLKEHPADPEAKKLRVQSLDPKKATTEEERTSTV
jgi:hypothetical protein